MRKPRVSLNHGDREKEEKEVGKGEASQSQVNHAVTEPRRLLLRPAYLPIVHNDRYWAPLIWVLVLMAHIFTEHTRVPTFQLLRLYQETQGKMTCNIFKALLHHNDLVQYEALSYT